MSNLKDFHEKKKKLVKQKNAIDETIDLKQINAEKEAENIRLLTRLRNRFKYLTDTYDDAPTDVIESLDDFAYRDFIRPLEDMRTAGVSAVRIRDESRKALSQSKDHITVLNTAGTTASSVTTSLEYFVGENPKWFPRHEVIRNRYKPKDELQEQIEYIKTQLPKITPDISEDFNSFVQKFYIFKNDKTKYQELIGGRSMFFFKLVFDFTNKRFGLSKNRREQILRFVFGNASPKSAAEPFLDNAKRLWDELSSQDAIDQSVKMGRVTPAYVEAMFRKTIAVMASLLQLREEYFSM